MLIIQVAAVLLVGIAMCLALAHALEFPGKMRLDQRTYMAVQAIYYPGFTIGGAAEPLAIIATLILVVVWRNDDRAFWWALSACIAVIAMHVIFWTVTQPTNRYWLNDQQLSKAGATFFAMESGSRPDTTLRDTEWAHLRDRWEYSHIARAVLSAIALIAVTVAIAR